MAVCFPTLRVSTAHVVAEARALVRKTGARRAAAALARRYGLGVFDALNTRAIHPEVRTLLELPPRKAARRPTGSTTRDLEAFAMAELHDALGVPRDTLVQIPKRKLGDSEPAASKWFHHRLRRGRALHRATVASKSPDAPTLTFLQRYLPSLSDDQARRDLLKRYLRPMSLD